MSGTAADAMVAGGGAKNGEVTFSTGMTFGFHWLVGIEHEITPGISLGVDILTNFGGKVVTEKIANTSDTVKTGPGIQAISNTQSQSATDTALTQTVNLSGTRINIAVMKAF
jgi:hypothetical protein